jgi:hypothetical protein
VRTPRRVGWCVQMNPHSQTLTPPLSYSPQVYDLTQHNPEAVLRALHERLAALCCIGNPAAEAVAKSLVILVAGGDGSLSWVLKAVRCRPRSVWRLCRVGWVGCVSRRPGLAPLASPAPPAAPPSQALSALPRPPSRASSPRRAGWGDVGGGRVWQGAAGATRAAGHGQRLGTGHGVGWWRKASRVGPRHQPSARGAARPGGRVEGAPPSVRRY